MPRTILRYIVGLIFIASGFVKAIDTVGFSFKLEEYFAPTVFNMPFLEKFALPIAIFVAALEVILGLMLLLKIQLKKTLLALIALCVFFAFLTFYSAYFNKVTDCGCFGDAIKFTPWQSFFKDILLLIGLIGLWFWYKKSENFEKNSSLKSPFLWLGILTIAFVIYWGNAHEPLIDFRDYKIGTDINAERKKIDEDPSEFKTVYVLKNTKTGEEKKVNQDDYINVKEYWEEGTSWQILEDKTTSELVKQGYKSEIVKFKMADEMGNDLTPEILQAEKAVLLYSYKPKQLSAERIAQAEKALKGNAVVYGISTAKNTFKTIPNLTMDETAMKTIARSNPFVVILQKGKIMEKKSLDDFIND